MKRINDTYVALSEEKITLGKKTSVFCDEPIVLSYLAPLLGGDGGAAKIRFFPFDAAAQALAEEFFPEAEPYRADGYLIVIRDAGIDVFTDGLRGRLYAAVCLAAHYEDGIGTGAIYNLPLVPFRAMKTFIPPRTEIGFFKEFIDICITYGFNTLMMEVGGAMEYRRHPEINEGWEEFASMFRGVNGKSIKAQRCMMHLKNSIHRENGGGSFLRQEELRELLDYAGERGIEVIPEIPSLSHSDYLLTRHPELAENAADPIPDTYCPLHPEVYNLLFDVLDEVLEVFHPKTVHIAHDEWFSACLCPRCRTQDPAKLFEDDVKRIYAYLTERGIKTMMWADMLVQCVDQHGNLRGSGMTVAKIPTAETIELRGRIYNCNIELWGANGARRAQLGGASVFHAPLSHPCIENLPRDIVMMNWMHHYEEDLDLQYLDRGYPSVYGNFGPRAFRNWFRCIGRGVTGAAISNWSMFDLTHMQRMGVLFSMAYASMMMWCRSYDENDVHGNTLAVGHELFAYQRRRANAPYSVEVVHAFTDLIPHEPFWDGVTIDYEHDRLGYYRIDYKDGTCERRDIYYGCNIGVLHEAEYDVAADPSGTAMQILEPTYSCDYEIADGKIYYRLAIDADKEIASVTPEIFPEYTDKVKILRISECKKAK